jgi:cyclopropane-fatty-acyl-phospholipid synthase
MPLMRGLVRHRHTVAATAGEILHDVADGQLAALPVTVRFWDDSYLPAAARPGESRARSSPGNGRATEPPVVVARTPTAVSHLLHTPSELGLARAWVDGSLTVRGDLEDVLATRGSFPRAELSRRDRMRLALTAVRVAGPRVLRAPPIPAIEAAVGRRGRWRSDHNGGRRHSLARDRRAVRHHYDVSNDFYRLVLGPTMVYSCAYFTSPDDSLEDAQTHKLDLICRKLALTPGERLLDVGCGWGSLVLHAAQHYGVTAVGVTLSEPQAQLARERITQAGLADRVQIRVADYRELADAPFHKIASVGMYEHVGLAELQRYVSRIHELLAPGGLFLNHGIARLASRPPEADTFISRYVFPDGELHPLTELIAALGTTGFEVRDVESLREHYPLTLRRWAANLQRGQARAVQLVGSERERAWQLYMLGSAQAFDDGEITVYQVLSARGGAAHRLPLDRAHLLGDALGGAAATQR